MSTQSTRSAHDPKISSLTRRQLLQWGALAGGGGAAAGLVAWLTLARGRGPRVPEGYRMFKLPGGLTANPAFSLRKLPDGRALAWTRREGGTPLAYELNRSAHGLLRLCDGRRSAEDICSQFQRLTGRPEAEARDALADLKRKGLVVEGGYVVIPAGAVVRTASDAS